MTLNNKIQAFWGGSCGEAVCVARLIHYLIFGPIPASCGSFMGSSLDSIRASLLSELLEIVYMILQIIKVNPGRDVDA